MTKHTVQLNKIIFGQNKPFVFISGPCVIESKKAVMDMAAELKDITGELNIPFVFKASYDKANRTSIHSFRGPGISEGLDILQEVKSRLGVPVISDIHCVHEIAQAAQVLDILQIPAFLCRQTDLLVAAAKTQKIISVKKGQFLAPWDVNPIVEKIRDSGNEQILLTERGVSFGYNNLVTDFRSLAIMRETGCPVVFDASHSVQQPGGLGSTTGGKSEFIPLLARCAVAAGCDAIFLESHTDPAKALSDGPNMLPISQLKTLLIQLQAIDRTVKQY